MNDSEKIKFCQGRLPLPLCFAIALALIFVGSSAFKAGLDGDKLVECRAEQAEVEEHMDRKTYVSEEAYRDMLEGWPRYLSETCQAVLQNHQ